MVKLGFSMMRRIFASLWKLTFPPVVYFPDSGVFIDEYIGIVMNNMI
jgi:hypothetical protein